jgi:hypothetical protein
VKNRYFADRCDFHTYDLLLHLMGCGPGFGRLVMAWWLTADEDSRLSRSSLTQAATQTVGARRLHRLPPPRLVILFRAASRHYAGNTVHQADMTAGPGDVALRGR